MNQIKAFMDKSNLFLTENTVLRYLNFSALYTAQGIPEGITFFAIPAWLAMNGKTPMELAVLLQLLEFHGVLKYLLHR